MKGRLEDGDARVGNEGGGGVVIKAVVEAGVVLSTLSRGSS